MDVAGQNDFLAGFHRGEKHGDDAAGGAVNEIERLVRVTNTGRHPFGFQQDGGRVGKIIEPDGGVHVATVNPLAKNFGRAIIQVSHVMPGNVEG